MSTAIWKYSLVVTNEQEVVMPRYSRVLCVQAQHETPCLWACVDPESKLTETMIVRTYGTGQPFDGGDLGAYLGTYQLKGGLFVGHVFGRIK